jgi:hypothetical protein
MRQVDRREKPSSGLLHRRLVRVARNRFLTAWTFKEWRKLRSLRLPVKTKSPAKAMDKILRDRPKRLRCFLRARMESADGFSGAVRVRNLSERGMGAISGHSFREGEMVTVTMQNIGRVSGRIAWAHKGAFGVYFPDEAIDPDRARKTSPDGDPEGA